MDGSSGQLEARRRAVQVHKREKNRNVCACSTGRCSCPLPRWRGQQDCKETYNKKSRRWIVGERWILEHRCLLNRAAIVSRRFCRGYICKEMTAYYSPSGLGLHEKQSREKAQRNPYHLYPGFSALTGNHICSLPRHLYWNRFGMCMLDAAKGHRSTWISRVRNEPARNGRPYFRSLSSSKEIASIYLAERCNAAESMPLIINHLCQPALKFA